MTECELRSLGPADTHAIGLFVGQLLEPGDFIALEGDLGAGKTQFVRGLAAGAGLSPDETVSSPTFTIVNEYRCRLPLHHLDLYRLGSAREVIELGFDDYLSAGGATVVEWPDRLEGELPSELLFVRFHILDDDERRLVFAGSGDRHAALVGLIADWAGKKMF